MPRCHMWGKSPVFGLRTQQCLGHVARPKGICQICRVPSAPGVSISKLPRNFYARLLMLTSPLPPP